MKTAYSKTEKHARKEAKTIKRKKDNAQAQAWEMSAHDALKVNYLIQS